MRTYEFLMTIPLPGEGSLTFEIELTQSGTGGWGADCPTMGTSVRVEHPARERAILAIYWKLCGTFNYEQNQIEAEDKP